MHYTGVQRGSKDLSGTSEKSVSGNKLGNLAVFLRFSSIADLQSHRLHQTSMADSISLENDPSCVPRVYLTWAHSVFLAFFSFNRISNLRVFNTTFSSIPTAPTKPPSSATPLLRAIGKQCPCETLYETQIGRSRERAHEKGEFNSAEK